MKTLKARLTFTEELLGSANNNPDIHEDFIASKSDDTKKTAEEIAAIPAEEKIEESKTVFPRNADGQPIIWDYQVKGFLKDACGVLRTVSGTKSSKVKAFKKYIDGRIFPQPRQIPINFAPDGKYESGEYIGSCQRPLRASTAQGERVALANSETVKPGAWIDIEVMMLADEDEDWVKELLEYGALRGLGQWRNSGKGRFSVEYLS